MQEVFYEESAMVQSSGPAKTRYYIVKTFSVISYVIATVWGIIAVMLFPTQGNVLLNILFAALPFAVFLASGIILGKIKDKLYVDYDYTFVSGSIRFSRVIKNVKRKNILQFETSSIEKLGRYGSDTFERYMIMPDKKKVVLSSNIEPEDGKGFYYIVANVNGQKYIFVLECSETFISYVIRYSNRTVIEDGFLRKKQ
nr:hypothetical protein [Clostridia bacterium]